MFPAPQYHPNPHHKHPGISATLSLVSVPSPSFRNCRNDVSDVNDVGIQLSLHRGAAYSLSLLRLTEAGSDACNRRETTDRRGKCGPRMFELSDTSRSGSRSVRLGNTEIRKEEGYDVINEVNLHSSYSLKLLFT